MRRFATPISRLALALAMATGLAARADETAETLGIGRAYERIGEVPVMHQGRIKPFDTVAREEVKQIFGRETIKLRDPRDEVAKILGTSNSTGETEKVQKWGPVGAFLGWTVQPEYWDEQPFILVDYLPLRRALVAGTLATRAGVIAAKSSTPEAEKSSLRMIATDPEPTASAISLYLRGSKLPPEDRESLAELAAKLTEEHKWLAPRELREATIIGSRGTPTPFMEWASAAGEKLERFEEDPHSADRPSELERRGVEAARRLMTYTAYSGDRMSTAGVILIEPRPIDAKYLAFTAETIKVVRGKESIEGLSPMQLDALKALDTYWNLIPRDDHKTPGEDAKADEKFSDWLRDSSTWVPLKTILKEKPEVLASAGYRDDLVHGFVDAYRKLERAELDAPGHADPGAAEGFLSASRSLGEAASKSYPTVARIERETKFNSLELFSRYAPIGYGAGLLFLVLSLAMLSTSIEGSWVHKVGKVTYWLGMAELATGIATEVYGFFLRIQISGWAPVTNMYETVIWVALVAAVLSLIFELIYRQVYMGLSGAAVAMLGTITAANVPLLDPSIKGLQPVLRSNLWLTIHVLTEVSSYAAFALAWMLGLIATVHYLTATYRRSPKLGELVLPMVPGLILLTSGAAGVAAADGRFGTDWMMSNRLLYVFAFMGFLGEALTLAAVLAVAGELIGRAAFGGGTHDDGDSELPTSHVTPAGPVGVKPTVAEIRALESANRIKLDARGEAMQRTASRIKPLSNFIYRTMQVGVLLIAAGTILGGVWADYSWGRFWGWDPKEVWALITLLVYLIPLHGRFAGWVNTFWLVFASVFCFLSVVMAWYGVNFLLGVGLHSYGFVEGGSQGAMGLIVFGMLAFPMGAAWRRALGYRPMF